ncbi:uncharacterized protein A1O9_00882 [Exophiala aquamarina CBS 119918]|uniref:Major facilitator superfamily (MFS) profile domain-containing protein n=1 Tax=Exophiala aquamarina CBS 119918 TaxID=1182545 RepID=A0A072PU83_9EURO|nr:uncharacterized protein A1O9_00882 [Exophiala aquamarina CBS 119918]KEF62908.1 hypothetical protein A1O9_00882 [Exophiala aquamarina CBS 119918]
MAPDEVAHLKHYGGKQSRSYNVLMLFIVASGSITVGYANAVISTVLAQPSFVATFNLATRPDANQVVALVISMYFLGGFIGSLTSFYLSDRYGRETMGLYWLVVLASACFITFRFFSGVWAFMLIAAVPIWMCEVAPPSIRGTLVEVHNVGLMLEYIVATWAGYGSSHITTSANNAWRAQFALLCLPALLMVSGLYWVPESPRWLILQDSATEAEIILHRLHPAEEARVELIQIQRQIELDRTLETSFLSMFTKPSYRRRCITGFGIACAVQMCGPLVINNYATRIHVVLGFPVKKQLEVLGGFVTSTIIGAGAGLYLIQKLSRPYLIAGGLFGRAACLAG